MQAFAPTSDQKPRLRFAFLSEIDFRFCICLTFIEFEGGQAQTHKAARAGYSALRRPFGLLAKDRFKVSLVAG
jgi:hypothetical protein